MRLICVVDILFEVLVRLHHNHAVKLITNLLIKSTLRNKACIKLIDYTIRLDAMYLICLYHKVSHWFQMWPGQMPLSLTHIDPGGTGDKILY